MYCKAVVKSNVFLYKIWKILNSDKQNKKFVKLKMDLECTLQIVEPQYYFASILRFQKIYTELI